MTQATFFDGASYAPEHDLERLRSQFERVRTLMADGHWRTLDTIKASCGGTDASISARLRDLRKPRFGALNVERRRIAGGLWEYRVTTANVEAA
jgi:hypothetical protein